MAVCDCPVGASSGPTLASTCGGSQFMLFMGLLEVFIRSQCDLEDPCGRASPRVRAIKFKLKDGIYYTKHNFYVLIVSIRAGL